MLKHSWFVGSEREVQKLSTVTSKVRQEEEKTGVPTLLMEGENTTVERTQGKVQKGEYRNGMGILCPLMWERLTLETRHLACLSSTMLQQIDASFNWLLLLKKYLGWADTLLTEILHKIPFIKNSCHLAPAVIAMMEIAIHNYQKKGCHTFKKLTAVLCMSSGQWINDATYILQICEVMNLRLNHT